MRFFPSKPKPNYTHTLKKCIFKEKKLLDLVNKIQIKSNLWKLKRNYLFNKFLRWFNKLSILQKKRFFHNYFIFQALRVKSDTVQEKQGFYVVVN